MGDTLSKANEMNPTPPPTRPNPADCEHWLEAVTKEMSRAIQAEQEWRFLAMKLVLGGTADRRAATLEVRRRLQKDKK